MGHVRRRARLSAGNGAMDRSGLAQPGNIGPPRVAVVGAGPCGLTAVKNLIQAGLEDIACIEESEAIGGQWAFREG